MKFSVEKLVVAFYIALAAILVAAAVLVKSEVGAIGKAFTVMLLILGISLASRVGCDEEEKDETEDTPDAAE